MDIEFIKDLARKYANVCEFKSDFPHDWKSVNDGYIEGYKTAERLVNENLTIPVVSCRLPDIYNENNTERIKTYKNLAELYNVDEGTVRDIFNDGAEWYKKLVINDS